MKKLLSLLFCVAALSQTSQNIDNINAMTALRVTASQLDRTVVVAKYWEGVEGGGGTFKFSEGPPAGGTNVVNAFKTRNVETLAVMPDGYWYRTELAQPVDVRMAGATASTSATAATKNVAALQFLATNFKNLSMSPGRWGINDTVTLGHGCQLSGAATADPTTLAADEANVTTLVMIADNRYCLTTTNRNWLIEGIRFEGATGLTNIGGINMTTNPELCVVRHCVFLGGSSYEPHVGAMLTGIRLAGDGESKMNTFQGLRFHEINATTNAAAIRMNTSQQDQTFNIYDSTFYACRYSILHTGTAHIGGFHMYNCQVSGDTYGVYGENMDDTLIEGSHFERSGSGTNPSIAIGMDASAIDQFALRNSSVNGIATVTNLVVFGGVANQITIDNVRFLTCNRAAVQFLTTFSGFQARNNAFVSCGSDYNCVASGAGGALLSDNTGHYFTETTSGGLGQLVSVDGILRARDGQEMRRSDVPDAPATSYTNWSGVDISIKSATNATVAASVNGAGGALGTGGTNINLDLCSLNAAAIRMNTNVVRVGNSGMSINGTGNTNALDVVGNALVTGTTHVVGVLSSASTATLPALVVTGAVTVATGNLATINTGNAYVTNLAGVGVIPSTNALLNLLGGPTTSPLGTGGTITTYLDGLTTYKVHTFTNSGTFVSPSAGVSSVSALVIAGAGGGAGDQAGGGGGAGGVISSNGYPVTPAQSITVTVGAGGARATVWGVVAANGTNSVFGDLTAIGGGGAQTTFDGAVGGSGGGGGYLGVGGAGTALQGYAGGAGASGAPGYPGGGGGGSGGIGGNATGGAGGLGGNGGIGTTNSITGTAVAYASGGGGGTRDGTGGTASPGGGGAGGGTSVGGSNGTANSGGGGGGNGNGFTAGDGGSGIVIVRYAITMVGPQLRLAYDASNLVDLQSSASGNLTVTPSGGGVTVKTNVTVPGTLAVAGAITGNSVTGTNTISGGSITATTNFLAAAGSAAAPAYSKTGDTDTGLFFLADNSVSLGAGGNASYLTGTNGMWGIGTTGPGAKLDVSGAKNTTRLILRSAAFGVDGDYQDLSFYDSTAETARIRSYVNNTADAQEGLSFWTYDDTLGQRVTILGNGNVGIGTNAPASRLHISGNTNSTIATITAEGPQLNVNTTTVFLDLRSQTGSEATIAGTAVPGVIAYNTFTGTHYTECTNIMDFPAAARVGALLEIVPGAPTWTRQLKQIGSTNVVSVTNLVNVTNAFPVVDSLHDPVMVEQYSYTPQQIVETKQVQEWEQVGESYVLVNKLVVYTNTVQTITGTNIIQAIHEVITQEAVVILQTNIVSTTYHEASAKGHLFKTRVARALPANPRAIGVWMGRNKEGQDLVASIGTCVIWVSNDGGDIAIGDNLQSSSTVGCAQKQLDAALYNYTVASATEGVTWANEGGKIRKRISVNLMK